MTTYSPGSGSVPHQIPATWPLTPADWQMALPVLTGERVSLRELRLSDAPRLYAELTRPEVRRFSWPPPADVAAFEQYIEWTHASRNAGRYLCYGVVPRDQQDAWGLLELRSSQPIFFRAELGFAIAAPYWGSGMFSEAARLLIDFAFKTLKTHRIEARVPVENVRGNEALRKLGATQEGTLKDGFLQDNRFSDQHLWAFVENRWDPAGSGTRQQQPARENHQASH